MLAFSAWLASPWWLQLCRTSMRAIWVRQDAVSDGTGLLIQLTVDELICASSMVMLNSAQKDVPVPALARWLLGYLGWRGSGYGRKGVASSRLTPPRGFGSSPARRGSKCQCK